MKRLAGSHIFFAAVMWIGCAQFAFSQSTAALAQLNGTVEDESSGVVAKASIALREMDTNRIYTTTSNEAGFYVLPNIQPGRYELKVAYAGFGNFTQTGVVLSVGQTATVNVVLKVASVGGEVTVTSEARPIEP